MYIELTSEMGLEKFHVCQDSVKRNFLGLECQQEVLPGKQSPGALFFTQTQKAVQIANGATERGRLLTEFLTTMSFCYFTGDREVQQKRQTSTM